MRARKAPSRTRHVREGALRKIYEKYIFFRKAPSRTRHVREGALRKIYEKVYIFCKAPSHTPYPGGVMKWGESFEPVTPVLIKSKDSQIHF